MAKQQTCQRYIYKLRSSRLRNAHWNLTLPLDEARRNDEVIALADSQVLRWLDELNGTQDADERAKQIRAEIKNIRSKENSIHNKRRMKQLMAELDDVQYKPDYMCLIIDKDKDYYNACRGFYINGMRYVRLLATNGGVKNSTIVFIAERHADEIKKRIDNGRNMDMPLVTAKLETYKALTCSASIPVSFPRGVIIVNDYETTFNTDMVFVSDEDKYGIDEPFMEERKDESFTMNACDGYGIMLPSLAERWSSELNLDYTMSGANTRFSFEKGMVFTFDFIDFAEKVAGGNYKVKDAWGVERDVRDAELILTTSMVKLWDSYDSCDSYITNSLNNKYAFGIAKTCPKELDSERALNYQFIQSYDLSDDDIHELIEPTINEIKDVINGDWRKTLLFLRGSGLNLKSVLNSDDDFVKALMIDRRMSGDPFIQHTVYQLIRNRIKEAKVGVINVHANYSIASGDPYGLCQSIFGLPITGLLKAGEIYNKYWIDAGSESLACYRAPMTCHNNIRLVRLAKNDDVEYWYKYMKTCTIFNSWDTAIWAMNGMDFDGDIVFLTDNNVLVKKLIPLPALMCAQRKAEKKVSTEDDFIRSNIENFGNDIGQTTNWITSMFEVRSRYPVDSEEYKVLSYRIQCGQLYQQNSIDRAKGIICKPMPKTWYDRHAAGKIEDESKRDFYRSIVAEKKPYFMRYIYPSLMREYNTYIDNTNKNALREFQMTVDELKALPESHRTERQREFIRFYDMKMPVGVGDCVMNKICRIFEKEFDGYVTRQKIDCGFDYTIMRGMSEYSKQQYNEIMKLYSEYNKRLRNYAVFASYEKIDKCESSSEIETMNNGFIRDCAVICPDSNALCNIVLDICYTKNSTKKFAWSMCGKEIIHNLLKNNGNTISYPVLDDNGDFAYCGRMFSVETSEIGDETNEYRI